MNITFIPLAEVHFSLLIKWLLTPHVKLWWDQDIQWTPELIREKYEDYVKGSKLVANKQGELVPKPIYAYIINLEDIPIGYIQYYNVHVFPRDQNQALYKLPKSCAGLDLYIGEVEFIGKNIGSKALGLFIRQHVFQKFDYVFVDPDAANMPAIRSYEKAGFRRIKKQADISEIWMIMKKNEQKSNLNILVRTAQFSDILALQSLLSQLGYPVSLTILETRFKKFIKNKGYGIAVASVENQVIGFVAWSVSSLFVLDKVRFHIEGLIVDEKYRGYGVGKKLMFFVENIAHKSGPAMIDLTSGLRRAKDGSHEFYRALGYQNEGNMAKLYLRKEL